jgi:hypothetical protein
MLLIQLKPVHVAASGYVFCVRDPPAANHELRSYTDPLEQMRSVSFWTLRGL